MGRLERAGRWLRQAFTTSRDTLRAARERAERSNGELAAAAEAAEAPPAGSPAAGGAGEPGPAAAMDPDPQSPPPPPAAPSIDDAVPRSLRIAAAWSWRLIIIAAVGWGLLWLTNRFLLLVGPLMIGLLLAGLLMPAQRGLLKLRVNRSLGALLVVIGGIAAVGGTLYLVVVQFIAGLDEMTMRVERGIADIEEWLRTGPFQMDDAQLESLVDQGIEWVNENTSELTEVGISAVTGTVQFLTGMVLAIVATFFFLRDGGRIWRFLVGMLPSPAREPMAFAGEGAWGSLSGYVRATVLVALVDAIGIGLGLWVLSRAMTFPIGLVLPLAALVFLGGFVPIVGAFVSGTVAVLVGLVSGETPQEGVVQALIVLAVVVAVQQLESNVLQPFIVSRMVRIHPLAVIIAVMAGILLAGIFGALVAVPVVAVLNTVIRRLNLHHHRHRLPPVSTPATGGANREPST